MDFNPVSDDVKYDPARFTEYERPAWVGFLRVHSRLTRVLDEEMRAGHGLTLSEFEVLLHLDWAPGHRLRMADLAGRVMLSPAGITRVVSRLVATGLVNREVPPDNRRVVLAVLTDPGRTRLSAARRTHLAGVRRFFTGVCTATELQTLATVWNRIEERLRS